jgi:hypothetical protein
MIILVSFGGLSVYWSYFIEIVDVGSNVDVLLYEVTSK